MTEATWVLVGVTTVLAILTGWYAWLTSGIVRRMDREREELSRPWLTFQLVPWHPNVIKLRVENLGAGPAMEIKGKIETELKDGNRVPFNWSYHLLASGKFEEFGFPMPEGVGNGARFYVDKIREIVTSVRADFSYSSVSSHQYQLQDIIDIGSITNDWIGSRMMVTEDRPDRLMPRIAKALEDLAKRRNSG